MLFRHEACIYLSSQISNDLDSGVEDMLDGPIHSLSTEKQEWLSQQPVIEDAFRGVLEEVVDKREKWQILRS